MEFINVKNKDKDIVTKIKILWTNKQFIYLISFVFCKSGYLL